MSRVMHYLIGPRIPIDELQRRPARYMMPRVLLTTARVLLLVSIFFPYWHMELEAPQYPNGLFLTAYINHLDGDVQEIDSLNHYIGMRPLEEAAAFERAASIWLIIAMVLLVEGAAFVHTRWAVLLALPAVLFPVGFLLDLHLWMRTFGQNLDPSAPLSSSIKPFTPTILGEGGIGQFRTYSDLGVGYWLAAACAVLTVIAFVFHRRAFKPLYDRAVEGRGSVAGGRMNRTLAILTVLAVSHFTMARSPSMHEAPRPHRPSSQPITMGEIGKKIAEAPEGSVIDVSPGIYREHLRIDKPITLVGRGLVVIDGGGSGDILEITAPDVTIRGLTFRNTGIDLDKENAAIRVLAPRAVLEDILFGIDLREAPSSIIRGNRIGGKKLDIARRGDGLRLWRSDNTIVEDNIIHDGRDAILWYSSGIIIRRNISYDCRYGLHLMFSDEVIIEDNEFTRNSVGVYLMYSSGVEVRGNRLTRNRGPSGYGLGLKETDRFTVAGNLITGNRVGVYIDGSPFTDRQPGLFTRNTFAYNDIGVTFLPSARGNLLMENNFIDNIDQVAVSGRGNLEANSFWKGEVGNYWSDYTGFDQDRDGIGDFVHESQTLFENMMDKEPRLRLFLFSPAQQAVEFVGRAIPAVRPEPKFTDEVPLMRPVPIALSKEAAPGSLCGLAAAGGFLLLAGGGVIALARVERSSDRRAACTRRSCFRGAT